MYSNCYQTIKAFAHKKNFQQPLKKKNFLCKNHIFHLVYIYIFKVPVLLRLRYSQYKYSRIMHNMVRTKQKIFKQPCQSFRTNSELLPASAYNCSMRAVLRRSRLTRSAAIFLRLTARDCFFLGAICGREQGECYYLLRKHIEIDCNM